MRPIAIEKEGFTFWRSFYDAWKAAEDNGHGYEYLQGLIKYAFEGVMPETKDATMKAFYSAAIPVIDTSMQNRKNGQRGGRSKDGKTTG